MLQPLHEYVHHTGRREIGYRRHGDVGIVDLDAYNGALSTSLCRRLTNALRHAVQQPTKVLLIRGGDVFSNGIHLNVIHAAASPALEAWRNINAIDDACREIITCTSQLVVASMRGNAGAGGVMLALGADRVVARDGIVLNPHYATMGLYGSEYWTYVLPRRVGETEAAVLTGECLPIDAAAARPDRPRRRRAARRPADEFDAAVLDEATRLAAGPGLQRLLEDKRAARAADERRKPLEAYRAEELAEMSRDIFDDRHGFAAARHAFVTKQKPSATPTRLAA